MTRPPAAVGVVLEAAALLLGVPDAHLATSHRRMLQDGLSDRLAGLDLEAVPIPHVRRARKLLCGPSFDDEAMRRKNLAAAHLAAWCRAVSSSLAKTGEVGRVPAEEPSDKPCAEEASGTVADSETRLPSTPSQLVITPDLSKCSESELSQVFEMEVSRPGVGIVVFHGVTDCRGLDIGALVHLDVGQVQVYPDQGRKPPRGEGLNKPATVMLHQCWPLEGLGHSEDPGARERYRDKVRQLTEDRAATFLDYDCGAGVWTFLVEGF